MPGAKGVFACWPLPSPLPIPIGITSLKVLSVAREAVIVETKSYSQGQCHCDARLKPVVWKHASQARIKFEILMCKVTYYERIALLLTM